MKIGKILGFEVTLDRSWFIVFALALMMLMGGGYPHFFHIAAPAPGLALAAAGALLLFGSVLAHELGHSVVGRALGMEIEGITLFIFGGVARLKDEPRTPGVELKMTAAGPAVSALLAAVFYGLGRLGLAQNWPATLVGVLGYLALANRAIAVFNLIPAFPLDGGRLFRAALWAWKRDVLMATRWAARLSRVLACALIVVGVALLVSGDFAGLWYIPMGMFVIATATAAYQQVLLRTRLENVSVASLVQHNGATVPAGMALNWIVDEHVFGRNESAFTVMENEEVRGILTLDDIRAVPTQQWPWTMAVEACQPVQNDAAIEDRADAWMALSQMLATNVRRLLVTHDGHIEGVLTREQVMELLQARPR